MRRSWRAPVGVALAMGAVLTAGCGGTHRRHGAVAATAPSPKVNAEAVAKMVQGVAAAKDAGGRERAIQLLRESVALDKKLWEARYDLGLALAGAGDLAGAEDQLATAASLAPEVQEVALALGEVRQRRGEHKLAADGLGDYLEARPQVIDVRALYVAALRDAGQIDKAIREAREVLLRRPADAAALSELSLCHLAKGEKDVAQLLAKQAVDANPRSAAGHRALGLVALANGDDALAFQSFLKATQEDPRDATARLNMGGVLLRAGAYGKAEEQYRAILQGNPDDTDASIGLAAALRGEADGPKSPKLEAARAQLDKVLEREPHRVSALFNLGVLYAEFLKKPQEGRPYFERFLADAPSNHPARSEAERYLGSAAAAAAAGKAAPPTAPQGASK